MTHRLAAALVASALGVAGVACDGPTEDDGGAPTEDAGLRDAAIDGGARRDGAAPRDAAPVDGASTDAAMDGSFDASSIGDDSSIGDAGPSDGGGASDDAGSLPDTGPPPDAGPPPIPDTRDVYAPRPSVEQGATQSDPTSTPSIVFDVTFDEPIWAGTLHASDLVIEPAVPLTAVVVDSGDHQRFELRLSNLPHADARYEVHLPYGRVIDLNGNPNVPSVSEDDDVYYDDPASTVEVRPYIGVTPVMNTLPITFQIDFEVVGAVVGFEGSDVVNGGTAPGVVWELETLTPGSLYLARAVAVGAQGTVYPVVPAGATLTTTGVPNRRSFYLGEPVFYTPLPILQAFDRGDPEGTLLAIRVGYQGALRPATPVLFDWASSDGTAIAGVDYTASSGTDEAVGNGVNLRIPSTDDAIPEPHRDLSVRIRNVRGDVYVADDTGVATIINDDSGFASTGSNEEYDPDSRPTDIAFSAGTLYHFGVSPSGQVRLSRRNLDGSGGVVGAISGRSSGGLALDAVGYVYAVNTHSDGYRLDKKILGGESNDPLFPDVEVTDPTDVLEAADLAADATQLYVLGRRTSPAGETAWFVEARDVATGALATGFGTGGVLALDRAAGTTDESPIAIRADGASIFVLGAIDGAYRVERRSAATGALEAGFASAGVLALPEHTRVADIAVHAGALYVIGAGAGGAIVERYATTDGARAWSFLSPLDDPRCITASDAGVFFGGAREAGNHVEGWTLDGDPLWGRTLPERDGPQAVTAIAHEPGSHWVHAAGFFSYSDVFDDYRDWFWERRYALDGYRYTYAAAEPPE